MDLGVLVPQIGRRATAAALRDCAQAAEELGFAALWSADHVVIPAQLSSEYPYSESKSLPMSGEQPMLEMFGTLSFLAAVTSMIQLGVGVCVLPYRQPVMLAKQIATLETLSHGRFILGVGTGWIREEYDLLGVPFAGRGARTDDILEFLPRALGAEQPVAYAGASFEVGDAYFRPGAFQNRRVPVWVGGASSRALERVASYGDAWFPHVFGASPDRLRRGIEYLNENTSRPEPHDVALVVPLTILDETEGMAEEPWTQEALRVTATEFAQIAGRYEELGVSHMMLMMTGSPDERIRAMTRLAEHGDVGKCADALVPDER